MKLSIETSLLTLTGFVIIYLAITGPLNEAMSSLERAKREECAYKAIRAIDLAISTAVGGGSSSSFFYSPCEVRIHGSGTSLTASSGESSYSITYPFRVVASGYLIGRGEVVARWVNGTVYVEVRALGG